MTGFDFEKYRVEFSPVELPEDRSKPYVTHEGVLKIDTLELTVLMLSDGRRIIPKEDLGKFLDWLEVGGVRE